MARRRHLLPGAVAVLSCFATAGCMTGDRPTLASGNDALSGDPAIDAVLERLDRAEDAVFTANYDVTNNFGPVTRSATVTQLADGRRSVTVGDVRFLLGGERTETCTLDTDIETCSTTVDDVRLSDLQITHRFYSRSAASRLRTDAARKVGPSEGYTADIAGQPATCVSVPVGGGSKVWCALDSGPLASYQGPDVVITMTDFRPEGDESLLATLG